VARDDALGLGRTPGAGLVGVDRRDVAENGIDDRPGGLDAVLSGEQGGLAHHRVGDQPFIGLHLLRVLMAEGELDVFAHHGLAGRLRSRPDGDHDLRAQSEPDIVGG
jgi:hypothetical protein